MLLLLLLLAGTVSCVVVIVVGGVVDDTVTVAVVGAIIAMIIPIDTIGVDVFVLLGEIDDGCRAEQKGLAGAKTHDLLEKIQFVQSIAIRVPTAHCCRRKVPLEHGIPCRG